MPILSQSTQNLCLEMILYAEKLVPKYRLSKGPVVFDRYNSAKLDQERTIAIFIEYWIKIDWNNKESIRPVVSYLERAYFITIPKSSSPHRLLDASLWSDGFRFSNGRLSSPRKTEDVNC
ncbi:MAG: hypothetical protein EOP48_15905 [Sphingobacteriales bacterium]|nr:MAG: hypothetical protein EOP48_15905 [Sphingobacteriales bacterium]